MARAIIFISVFFLSIISTYLFSTLKVAPFQFEKGMGTKEVVTGPVSIKVDTIGIKVNDVVEPILVDSDNLIEHFNIVVPVDSTNCSLPTPWQNGKNIWLQDASRVQCYGLSFQVTEPSYLVLLKRKPTRKPFSLFSPECKALGYSSDIFPQQQEIRFPRSVEGDPGVMKKQANESKSSFILVAASQNSDRSLFKTLYVSVNNACGQSGSLESEALDKLLASLNRADGITVKSITFD